MLTWTNTNSSGLSQTSAKANMIVNATVGYRGIWVATAQDLTDETGKNGTVAEAATRTSTLCYMRGLSEHIRIQTSSGLPWFWRRLCFTLKGDEVINFSPSDTPVSTNNRFLDTTQGIQRLFFNELVNTQTNTINNHDAVIFKGSKGVDWTDPIIAPTNTSRITVKYDKTWTLTSGNASGMVTERKLWFSMNKNLMYADDETGDQQLSTYFSTDSKQGMGDYYIMDVLSPGTGGGDSDKLLLQANSTLYWHER